MKAWARGLGVGLLLAAAIAPAAGVAAAPGAEQILLDKASYWRLKDRPDLAIDALQQLLSINPNQPEALYQFGIIEVQQGKTKDAQAYLARLQKAAPGSPRIADLENAIRAGQVSPNQLSEARRLAQSGQFSQAAQKYQQTFRGPPPPTFGVEYYMTLAGTPQGWDEAHRGLEGLVQKSPNDSRAKLALAEVLTYHADTRARGIHLLEPLAGDPAVGAQAVKAWKQAVLWLGGSAEDRKLYAEYLAKYPQDADLRQHMAEAEKAGAGGPATPGYADLNRGNLGAAERAFEAELQRDANDPGALAGLGIVRLRQHRLPQARELLEHAVREYRRVLAANPSDSAAQAGLRGALAAERSAETAGLPRRGAAGPPVSSARARADQLRAEGSALEARGDAAAAQAKYLEAVAVDPSDPWARLDYARFLAGRGNLTQAFQIVDPAASGNSAESLQAAALFYSEHNRMQEAVALVDRIPPAARSADVRAFRERILATSEIDRAKQLARAGNRAAARNILISLYSRPPQTDEKARLVADALSDIGDSQEALQLARPNAAAAARDKKAALDYAALLFKAGRDAEAVAYLTQAESSGRITAADRRQLEHIKIDIAIKRADALRERGDVAGAYDQISPLLNAYPNDASLLLAAGRLYAAAGQNSIAMRFVDAGFREAPGDLGVIRGAVGGAIVAGDLPRARAYLAAGMQAFPNNPRLYYLAAEIARANGDNGAAVYDLQMARRLDTQQAGAFEPLPAGPAPVPGSRSALPPNPFRQSQADAPALAPAPVQLASANPSVADEAALSAPSSLPEAAKSADSDDLVVPPNAGDRPRRLPSRAAPALAASGTLPAPPQLASLSSAAIPDVEEGSAAPDDAAPRTTQLAQQLAPLPPPPIQTYEPVSYTPPAAAEPLQPLPPPPIAGYQPPLLGQTTPLPRDSLELDIERSMAAISAEAGPTLQGGLALRVRSGEQGLSRLTDVGLPAEAIFSPFYTGTVRLQAVPTFLDAGRPETTALTRFGTEALLALSPTTPLSSLPVPSDQTAAGVSFNLGYAYQMFAGEIGTTPLGFPITNLVGRLALQWPGPAGLTTAYPTIPPPPGAALHPLQVKVEGVRQPVTESVLSYAGTKDPLSGLVWGGVIKTGGDLLVSYDDGFFGMYGGGGVATINGKSVADNSEIEGNIGGYVRPYHTANTAFKVGLNLSYMGYDKNLRFFTVGQGGYFSPQTYFNISVPLEYTGRYGRLAWLAGAALGLQNFHENSSPYFPTNPGNQATLQGSGSTAFYPARNVTGPSFFLNGQLEYQLDNGFSIGGLASVDNASNFTEGVGKVYLRKSFGVRPTTTGLTNPFAGSL